MHLFFLNNTTLKSFTIKFVTMYWNKLKNLYKKYTLITTLGKEKLLLRLMVRRKKYDHSNSENYANVQLVLTSSQEQILSKKKKLILKFTQLKFKKKEIMQLQLFGQMVIEAVFIHIKDYFLNKSQMHDHFLLIAFIFSSCFCLK